MVAARVAVPSGRRMAASRVAVPSGWRLSAARVAVRSGWRVAVVRVAVPSGRKMVDGGWLLPTYHALNVFQRPSSSARTRRPAEIHSLSICMSERSKRLSGCS